MGTRADFYVGRDPETMEWLGSIACDGYPEGIARPVREATTEAGYRAAVASFLAHRADATLPHQGWPWPWDDSRTTDRCYAFDLGAVYTTSFGYLPWGLATAPLKDEATETKADFPDMAERRMLALGPRSGLVIL